jgi:hypothetical protein
MNLELTDTMPIGKHKSKKIEDIFKENAGYLVWVRNARKEQNQDSKFFSIEVSALLDMAIRESKALQRKYKPWNLEIAQAPVNTTKPAVEQPSMAYNGWGEF